MNLIQYLAICLVLALIVLLLVSLRKAKRLKKEIDEAKNSLGEKNLELKEIKFKLEKAERNSFTDPLTGCYNRRGLDELVRREIDRSVRYGHQFSCLFVDLDNFNKVNNKLGHEKGDDILKNVAKTLFECTRHSDFVVRIGGDEFLVLLTETNCKKAASLSKRLGADIAALLPGSEENIGAIFGASIGCVSLEEGESFDDMVARADKKMYDIKDRRKR